MRLSFCFAAAAQATALSAQAASLDTTMIAHRAPPAERSRVAPVRIDPARTVKRTLMVGNRQVMVDQLVDDRHETVVL